MLWSFTGVERVYFYIKKCQVIIEWPPPPNCIVLSPASIISNAKTVNPAKLFPMVSNNYQSDKRRLNDNITFFIKYITTFAIINLIYNSQIFIYTLCGLLTTQLFQRFKNTSNILWLCAIYRPLIMDNKVSCRV